MLRNDCREQFVKTICKNDTVASIIYQCTCMGTHVLGEVRKGRCLSAQDMCRGEEEIADMENNRHVVRKIIILK